MFGKKLQLNVDGMEYALRRHNGPFEQYALYKIKREVEREFPSCVGCSLLKLDVSPPNCHTDSGRVAAICHLNPRTVVNGKVLNLCPDGFSVSAPEEKGWISEFDLRDLRSTDSYAQTFLNGEKRPIVGPHHEPAPRRAADRPLTDTSDAW
jgi:hypothetical protein